MATITKVIVLNSITGDENFIHSVINAKKIKRVRYVPKVEK